MSILEQSLSGRTPAAERALARLWRSLPERPAVCWYPSAGRCYRDLVFWDGVPGVDEPDLFVHTDYLPEAFAPEPGGRATLVERHDLLVASGISYAVEPDHAGLAALASSTPLVRLLSIAIDGQAGRCIRPVLYFHFENIEWFEQFVLERALQVSHLYKRDEGLLHGGCRTSVSSFFPFLAHAGCRFLATDREVRQDADLQHRLVRRYAGGGMLPFRARVLPGRARRSDPAMRVLELVAERGPAAAERLNDVDWAGLVGCNDRLQSNRLCLR
ncbi:hypothetical protein [Thioalkalivibrio sp.]|uniref:DUF7663 domain-containing protein n=1 Tax=Thioalkalivibrio sp. TaxID=2093813 RepID=UPI003976D227